MAFYPLEQLSRLHDGYQKAFSVDRLELLLVQQDGKPFILENRCPHMDVPLTHAQLLPSGKIRCRAHGIEFQLESGRAEGPLASQLDCLKKYPVIFDGAFVGVELP
ncbi:Rieske (2Fe-2S) protein [Teredinibacter purpureus]|uniref:Rieske (2Fe-2S) protein n=1 Tax=Teredinibacter purpureus TaxID=2731756 RepID=UPI0005F7C84E|nr:Rieske 2Fe-2S domain-containing protein [Teredinibacter purpureus]